MLYFVIIGEDSSMILIDSSFWTITGLIEDIYFYEGVTIFLFIYSVFSTISTVFGTSVIVYFAKAAIG